MPAVATTALPEIDVCHAATISPIDLNRRKGSALIARRTTASTERSSEPTATVPSALTTGGRPTSNSCSTAPRPKTSPATEGG